MGDMCFCDDGIFPDFLVTESSSASEEGEKKKVSLPDKGSSRRCVWPAVVQACGDRRGEAGAGRLLASSQWSWGGMPERQVCRRGLSCLHFSSPVSSAKK